MVDAIQSRTASAVNAAAASVPAQRVAGRREETVAAQRELTALAFDFGKAPPVDEKRVEDIRRAIRNGTYPVLPETIADRLLALKLNWTPKK